MAGTHFSGPVFAQGVPLVGGGMPFTFGTYYFVDSNNGSDDNNGLRADQAFATVSKAESTMVSGNHDVCIMSANAPHTISTELTITKSRMHFIGTGGAGRYVGQRTRWEMGVTTGDGIGIVQNTGNGNTFTNIKMRSTDTNTSSVYAFADGGEHTVLSYCALEHAALLGTTGVAELLANGDTAYYDHCTFGNTIYQITAARQNVLCTRTTIAGKVARDVIFEDCVFLSDTSDAGFVNVRATADDIERFMIHKNCMYISSQLSGATQTEAFGIASALTQAEIQLYNPGTYNITNIATASSGVFTNSPAGAALGGLAIQAD